MTIYLSFEYREEEEKKRIRRDKPYQFRVIFNTGA